VGGINDEPVPKASMDKLAELNADTDPNKPDATHVAVVGQEKIRRLSKEVLIERGGARAR
jgi:hypothetical protein